MNDDDYELFRALIEEFAAEAGLVMQDDSLGIEFEVEGHVTLIVPDPRRASRMLIDVSVLTLPDVQADLLKVLHQLNHATRIEHDWVITIDSADRLCLHTQREIAACKASDLQILLSEGIERAQALQTFSQQAVESLSSGSRDAPLTVPDLSRMIRV
jgi:hypothetical protein